MTRSPRDAGEQIVLEGPPPGSGRPSWLAVPVALVITLGIGVAVGYNLRGSVVTPSPSGVAVASASATVSVANPSAVFAADPCQMVEGLSLLSLKNLPAPLSRIGIFHGPVADLPGMRGCQLLTTDLVPVADVFVREAPTNPTEFSAVLNQLFQGDAFHGSSFGTQRGFVVPCSHFWTECHPAAVFLNEPYFVVVALEPGVGDVNVVSSLTADLLAGGFTATP